MFNKIPKNEKWVTARQREARNDVFAAFIMAPLVYVWIVLMCVI